MTNHTVLWVTGDETVQRYVYRRYGFGYFTAAAEVLFEKWGLLDWRQAPQTVLAQPEEVCAYDLVLIGWLPPPFWKQEYIKTLRQFEGLLFLEGPFPPQLEGFAGVERVNRFPRIMSGRVEVIDTALRTAVETYLGPILGSSEILLRPKEVDARPIPFKWRDAVRMLMETLMGLRNRPRIGVPPGVDVPKIQVSSYRRSQIRAWAKPPYLVETYRAVSAVADVVLQTSQDQSWPLLIRRGRILASTFQIFSYLVHYHTMHPLPTNYYSCPSIYGVAVGHLFLEWLEGQSRRHGIPLLKVAPWPWKYDSCLTIRHDMDRIPTPEAFERLINFEAERKLGVSWYWIPGRTNPAYMRRQVELGHEVGLHAVRIKDKPAECLMIEQEIGPGHDVVGECTHGGFGSDGWLGYPNIVAARDTGFLYTEHLPVYDFPYRFPSLQPDGTIATEPIIGISHSIGIDSMLRASPDIEALRRTFLPFLSNGFHCLIINHPDLHVDELMQFLDSLPTERRLDWTCRQVADWWRKTHIRRNLKVERIEETPQWCRFRVVSRNGVSGLTLEISSDVGEKPPAIRVGCGPELAIPEVEERAFPWKQVTRVRLDLKENEPIEVQIERWRTPRFSEIVRLLPAHLVDTPNSRRDYLLPRVSRLVQVLNRYTDYKDLSKAVIVDVGCGYGTFTLAAYNYLWPVKLIGFDISESYIALGNEMVQKLSLEGVTFVQGDMEELSKHVESANVLIINNSINFLTTPESVKQAIREFGKVLVPGGALIILTPNYLYPIEAFTKLIGVQFLPKSLATRYVRYRKRRHTYDDIRLPSPFELRRWLRQGGFEDIHVVDQSRLNTKRIIRYVMPRFYLTATKRKDP